MICLAQVMKFPEPSSPLLLGRKRTQGQPAPQYRLTPRGNFACSPKAQVPGVLHFPFTPTKAQLMAEKP